MFSIQDHSALPLTLKSLRYFSMKKLYSEIYDELPTTPLRRFFCLVSGERHAIWRVYLYGIFAGLIGLALPLGIQAVINLVSMGTLTTSWYVLMITIVGALLVAGVLQILQLVIAEALQQRIFSKSAP